MFKNINFIKRVKEKRKKDFYKKYIKILENKKKEITIIKGE